ncbi:protein translocase subunit SecF [Salinibaculum rarum]|uniref:protein translocase subunit SecF n=1 Tax=Salinibaculum rarum TaxID=3058903 RepID=UPI00265D9F06|nr:protein translocase subunit SecF [Salinibaculum sp. KK48]
MDFEVSDIDYEQYSNRQLALVPLAILGVALLVIAVWYVMFGVPVDLGIAFTGGTEVRFTADDGLSEVRETLGETEYDSIQSTAGGGTFILTTQAEDTTTIETAAEEAGYEIEQVQQRSATFGTNSQQQALLGLVVAFVGMSTLVFVLFRTFIPSIAVVVSAFSDIVIPLALMNVLDIPLTLGAVAALLMLVGYSVDSDILLNNHILRRRGGFYESAYRAMRTGITMTLTSIAAMVVMTIVATFFEIPLLPEIGLILVFGLTADLMNTYMLNMSLLRYYKYEGVAK